LFILPAPPDADNDETEGYEIGDTVHINGGSIYECRDASTGAALWEEHGSGGTGDMTKAVYDPDDDGIVNAADDSVLWSGYPIEAGFSQGGVPEWDESDLTFKESFPTHYAGGASATGNLPEFADTSGNVLQDSGVSPSSFAPAAKGVTNGDSHDHNGGDGAQISYATLSNLPTAVNNTSDIFRCDSCGTSGFTGTIATLPGGATLTYNVTSGNENTMVPQAAGQLAKQRLYNTTRGTHALISDCNAGTNTITLTANVPADWQVGDTITTLSQTVSGAGRSWVDLEITSGNLLGTSAVWIYMVVYDGGGPSQLALHPFETYGDSKLLCDAIGQVAAQAGVNQNLYKLNSNMITAWWTASGAATDIIILREVGYLS